MPRSKRSKAQVEHSKKLHEASCEEAKTSAELANLAQNRVDMRSAALTRASNAPPPLSRHYRPHNTCGCDGCRAKSPGDADPITKTILARDLRTQGAIAAELNAHGVEGAYVNGKPVFLKILRRLADDELVAKGAYKLTEAVEKTTGSTQGQVRMLV